MHRKSRGASVAEYYTRTTQDRFIKETKRDLKAFEKRFARFLGEVGGRSSPSTVVSRLPRLETLSRSSRR